MAEKPSIKLTWQRSSDKTHWWANYFATQQYACTITPPRPDFPLPIYGWEINGRHGGGASSLQLCKNSVAREIERREARLTAETPKRP